MYVFIMSRVQLYFISVTDKAYYFIVNLIINSFLRKYSLVDLGSAGALDDRLRIMTSSALRIDGRADSSENSGVK